MGFKTGLFVGAAVGYYLGARAGRQRYEQLDRYLSTFRESDAVRQARDAARNLVDTGIDATKQALKDATAPDSRLRAIS